MARPRLAQFDVVVDSNVIAYYLLKTAPFHREIKSVWPRLKTLNAPASWEAEILSVLWNACGAGLFSEVEARKKLQLAKALGIRAYPVSGLWFSALRFALLANHPTYDTLFVALATRLSTPLLTYDERLLVKFPQVAIRPTGLRSGL